MNCDQTDSVLQCYFDNELDALGAARFERHLENCPACVDQLAALKALRSSINLGQLYERTPPALRKTVIASVRSQSIGFGVPARAFWPGLALAASMILLSYVGWHALSFSRAENSERR